MKAKPSPDTEPDFYSMTSVMPDPDYNSSDNAVHSNSNECNDADPLGKRKLIPTVIPGDSFLNTCTHPGIVTPVVQRPINSSLASGFDCARYHGSRPHLNVESKQQENVGILPYTPFGSFGNSPSFKKDESIDAKESHDTSVDLPQTTDTMNSIVDDLVLLSPGILPSPRASSNIQKINEEQDVYEMSIRSSFISRSSMCQGSLDFPTELFDW